MVATAYLCNRYSGCLKYKPSNGTSKHRVGISCIERLAQVIKNERPESVQAKICLLIEIGGIKLSETKHKRAKKELSPRAKIAMKSIMLFFCFCIEISSFFIKPLIVIIFTSLFTIIGFPLVLHKYDNTASRNSFDQEGEYGIEKADDILIVICIFIFTVHCATLGFSIGLACLPMMPAIEYFTSSPKKVDYLLSDKGRRHILVSFFVAAFWMVFYLLLLRPDFTEELPQFMYSFRQFMLDWENCNLVNL